MKTSLSLLSKSIALIVLFLVLLPGPAMGETKSGLRKADADADASLARNNEDMGSDAKPSSESNEDVGSKADADAKLFESNEEVSSSTMHLHIYNGHAT
jgi:hypothetical protein